MSRIIFTFLFLIITFTSYSQIVNIEKARKEKNGFQTTISLDFNIKETGKRILELKNNIDFQYKFKAHNFIFLNNLSFLSVDEGNLINAGFQHLRYNYTLKDSSFLTLEVFGQYQYNEQKLLRKRILGGFGPRFRLLQNDKITWYFAPLAMYEYEQLSDSNETEINRIRLDAYTNFQWALSKFISFNLINYYQPDFADFTDYRISGESGIYFNLTKYLTYSLGYAFDFDNQPPLDVQNTFWYFKNTLVLKF